VVVAAEGHQEAVAAAVEGLVVPEGVRVVGLVDEAAIGEEEEGAGADLGVDGAATEADGVVDEDSVEVVIGEAEAVVGDREVDSEGHSSNVVRLHIKSTYFASQLVSEFTELDTHEATESVVKALMP
jgi:hypothetical protein